MADDDEPKITIAELAESMYQQLYVSAKEATKGTESKFVHNVKALNALMVENPASHVEWATALCFLLGASIVDQSNQLMQQFPDNPATALAAKGAIMKWFTVTIAEFSMVAEADSHGAGVTRQ